MGVEPAKADVSHFIGTVPDMLLQILPEPDFCKFIKTSEEKNGSTSASTLRDFI